MTGSAGHADAGRILLGLMDVGGRRIGIDIRHLVEVCTIQDLAPLMVGRREVLGVINLRGTMIPVLDPIVLCQQETTGQPPSVAAILEHGERLVALGVDRISGLSEIGARDVQSLYSGRAHPGNAVTGGVYVQGEAINLVDPEHVFALPDLPSSVAVLRSHRRAATDGARPYLTFRSGGATFALDAVRVFSTVPRQRITTGSLTGGHCLGTITYHDRRVPVMEANGVLGIGEPARRETPEIVIMHFPDDRLLGFAVDVICRIQLISKHDLRPAPGLLAGEKMAIGATLTDERGNPTFVLDPEALQAAEELRNVAEMSDQPRRKRGTAAVAAAGEGGARVVHEQVRHLVFTAGQRLAAPVTQVVRILEPPQAVTPLPARGHGVTGLFTVDEMVTPLVCLSTLLGLAPSAAPGRPRVLLVGAVGQRIGLSVQSLDGIESSIWRSDGTAELARASGLVQLRAPGGPHVLPRLDLEALAASVAI